jgi:Ca2+-binding EF-hand superfamily protein
MASEFQRRKIAGVFAAMDANGNGFLEEADFAALTDRWAGLRDWAPGTAEHERVRTISMGWWSTLSSATDGGSSALVSLDDVMNVVDQLPQLADAVEATAEAMFDAIDTDGDDRISLEEHKQVVYAWKGSDDGMEAAFPKLDLNGDGHLSREEFRELWAGFWRGDDQDSPSQYVFGPY